MPKRGARRGSAFSTSHEPPGRSGARKSSHATQSRISAIRRPQAASQAPRDPRRDAERDFMKAFIARIVPSLREAAGFGRFVVRRWSEDRCPQIAGSLTYTTLLAMVPMLV